MSKIYQLNIIKRIKRNYKEKLVKDIKIFPRRKKEKSNNMVVNNTKIYQKMKNKNLLIIEKKYEKMPYYN